MPRRPTWGKSVVLSGPSPPVAMDETFKADRDR